MKMIRRRRRSRRRPRLSSWTSTRTTFIEVSSDVAAINLQEKQSTVESGKTMAPENARTSSSLRDLRLLDHANGRGRGREKR